MRKTVKAVVIAMLTVFALPVAVAAQGQELTGSWTLSLEDSDFGNTRAPESVTLDIRQADDRLVYTSTRNMGGGPQPLDVDIATDGTEHTVETPMGAMGINAEWDEGILVIRRQAQTNVGAVEITDRHHVEEDGSKLRVESSIELSDSRTFEFTMVFVKSED